METMITPSTAIIRQILDDPDVDERIKVILRGDTDEDIAQALSLLASLYPDKYDFVYNIDARTATTAYESEFSSTQHSHEVAAYVSRFGDWLKQSVSDLPDDFVEIFEAAMAYYFDAHAYYQGLDNTVPDEDLLPEYFAYKYPLYHMIVAHYLHDVLKVNEDEDEEYYDQLFDGLISKLINLTIGKGSVNLEPAAIEALGHLSTEDWIYHDDDSYLYTFYDTAKWFASNPKFQGY
jgi:hypothetical protein